MNDTASTDRTTLRQLWQHHQREWGLILLLATMAIVVGAVDPAFLRWENGRDILVRSAPTIIVACGVTVVVLTGEIDISVGSLMALLAAVLGIICSTERWGMPLAAGITAVLACGTIMGAVTGLLVTWGKVPSILATLGLLTGLRGATLLLMGGRNIDQLPAALGAWTKYGAGGFPIGVWVAAAVVIMTAWLLHRTTWGRMCYAVGSNETAARMIGVMPEKVRWFAFTYTGFLTAVATLVDVPRLPKIEAGIGQGFELLVVTTVVVGGVSISGGRGRLSGVLLAGLLLTTIRPALTFLDLGEAGEKWTKAIQGAMILLAVVTDRWPGAQRRATPQPSDSIESRAPTS